MSAPSAKPDDLIEAYVVDVIKRLPARQRNDVGYELRALLTEDLRGRGEDTGCQPDEAMTLDLLRRFGNPDDVAARYHPPGVPIIPPGATRYFVWATLIGVGLQWAGSLPMAISAGDLNTVSRWWLTAGLGALWWPGFLVTVTMIAAFIRQRWPAEPETWKPKLVDRDHINRPLFLLGLAAALAGIGIWVALAWWASMTTSETPLAQVFAFDPDFLATRAPVVLLYWTFSIVFMVVLVIEGRWRALTRRFEMGLKLACCIMLAWIAFGGRVFIAETTNAPLVGILFALIVVLLADAAWTLWRGRARIRMPREVLSRPGS
ncbi:MAG: hypothetical protein ABMA14_00900 [Hyphomonadaceae bacterium]